MIAISPPRHVAIILKTKLVDPADFAFMVAAVAKQVRSQLCPAWNIAPVEVAAYTDHANLPPEVTAVIFIVDSDGNADSLGYHTEIGNRVIGFVDAGQTLKDGGSVSAVLSHEVCETVIDASVNTWAPGPDGYEWAAEACDPCEAVSYAMAAVIDGEARNVDVSDFVVPAFFDSTSREPGDFRGRGTHFDVLPGGYQILRDVSGHIFYLDDTGKVTSAADASDKLKAKLAKFGGRVGRRLA
jgi:hypothetical protein